MLNDILGISERTRRRRREEFGLQTDGFTEISENKLTAVVQSVKSLTPNIGQSCMLDALRSKGQHVQRWRVREIMKNIDLVGTALRWNQVVYSRKYSVPRPNALWHIDGHHKLIHWRLVVLACIDGYNRLPSSTNIVLTTIWLPRYLFYLRVELDDTVFLHEQGVIIGLRTYGGGKGPRKEKHVHW